ncbi:MAG: aminotransferase class I/II-fold pyridoxal phosphate-dependent enzyme [Candidatus Nanopelagicales bacterium]
MSAVTVVTLHEPVVTGHEVRFSWDVEPDSRLYAREHFTLAFPDDVDLTRIPDAVWWRIMMICLYPHWVLLRPCRVELPIRLPDGEREYWLRLCDAAVWTLEGRMSGHDVQRRIEIAEGGRRSPWPQHPDPSDVTVAAFSGGRDSLTQLGLLQELAQDPILVTVVSPRPGSEEHRSARHDEVMREVVARTGVELLTVHSDFRSLVHNDFAAQRYSLAVTELTDCLLYLGAAWVVALARGAARVALAAEAEVHVTSRRDGLTLQHGHFMYSGTTQRALAALAAPTGVAFTGLTAPLMQFQVQSLLTHRYPHLRDLQYSCWELTGDQGACSSCGECVRVAMYLLADDVSPSVASIDLGTLLRHWRHWFRDPLRPAFAGPEADLRGESRDIRRHQFRTVTVERVAAHLGDDPEALARYAELRDEALADPAPIPPPPGYRTAHLAFVDERFRAGLEAIVAEHFAPTAAGQESADRSLALSEWIIAPLGDPTLGRPRPPHLPVRGLRPTPPDPRPLTDAEMARVERSLPAPEPTLDTAADRVLRVSDTSLDGNEETYLRECIADNFVSSAGSFVTRFEEAFARAAGTRFAVSCSSGTAAVQLAYAAVGLGPGDEVIMPTFTMIATANAASHLGARPVFVDTDPTTWNLDSEAVAAAIGPRTRAIVLVHTYGQPVDPRPFQDLAVRNGLALIEDAAEAHGASAFGRPVGSLGDAAAFSFYGNKILTTGEGGMVTTDDPAVAASVRELRDHGFSPERHFWHRLRAYNFRMSNLQAAVGLAQVERLDRLVAARRHLADQYRAALADVPGIHLAPQSPGGLTSVHWMFGVLVDAGPERRDRLRFDLAAAGIGSRTFFVPLHLQPAYLREYRGSFPVAERLGRTGLYLPSAPTVTSADVARVAAVITRSLAAADL